MAARRPGLPDLPKEQVVAVVGGTLGLATSLGAPITAEDAQAIQTFVVVQGPVMVAAGAWIRTTRAKNWDKWASHTVPEPARQLLHRPDVIVFIGLAALALLLSVVALVLVVT